MIIRIILQGETTSPTMVGGLTNLTLPKIPHKLVGILVFKRAF